MEQDVEKMCLQIPSRDRLLDFIFQLAFRPKQR